EPEERRVLLHPIDEDEPTCILELALHGDQIELAAQLLGARLSETRGASVIFEARLHEGTVEDLVAVVEQGHEVVHTRPEERILEVDPAEPPVRPYHEVARLVIPVHEGARPGSNASGEAARDGDESFGVTPGEDDAPRLECPLPEVFDLPEQQVLVECP